MGEAFVSIRAPQFKHQQDKAYEQELKREDLFSDRREVASREYTCVLADGSGLSVGDTFIVGQSPAGELEGTVLNRRVAQFDASARAALYRDFFDCPVTGGMAIAQVCRISELGIAVIRLCE